MKTLVVRFALITALLTPAALYADPITGQFSIQGSVTTSATTLTFDPATIEVGGGTQTGDFATLLADGAHATAGTPVIIFSPTYTGGDFLTFQNLNIIIETLNAQTIGTGRNAFNIFSGTTLFQAAGFDDTTGTFSFSTQGSGKVTFSATGYSDVSPVPEPSSIAFLGTGLLAGAGILKKRFLA